MARKQTTKKTPRKPLKVSFDDEAGVLKEIAKELDIDKCDLDIRRGSAPNGYGDAYEISTRGGREWIVMKDDDEFEAAALQGVKNDLDENPENFEPSFIESHIDMKHLRDELHADCLSGAMDYASEIGDRRFWQEAGRRGIEEPEPDEDGDVRSPTDEEIESFAEDMVSDQLKDPMEYLNDIFGREDAVKKAIEIAGIDIKAAAKEAVSTDGAAHFMCGYDGNYNTSPSGFIYWRHN